LCALVIVGVNERGEKHFLAIEDGIRESTQSWREVLLDLKSRGLNAAELAVGDGALGFWAALEEVLSATRQQRCWMRKTGNVLNALPKSVQPHGSLFGMLFSNGFGVYGVAFFAPATAARVRWPQARAGGLYP
jgi:transposase-like protein